MELVSSIITTASIVFLVLEALILVVAALLGYKRRLGVTTVRAIYLILIGVGAFFAGRAFADKAADYIMRFVHPLLPAEIATLLESHPELQLELLLQNLIGAILIPFAFAILFGLFQLLTLICFKKLATKIVVAITKKEESPKWSKWAGAAAGLALGIAISVILLSPMFSLISIVEHIPSETIDIFEEAIGSAGMSADVARPVPATALKAHSLLSKPATKFTLGISKFFPLNNWASAKLTDYDIPGALENEHTHESAQETLPLIIAAAGDALYAYNFTANHGGTSNDAFTNAAAAMIPHLADSTTTNHIASDAMCLIGFSFLENGSFMGIVKPKSENAVITSMIDNLIDTVSHTSPATVEANMTSLFGKNIITSTPEQSEETTPEKAASNKGFLAVMMRLDTDDPVKSLEDTELADAVSESIANMAENNEMDNVINSIKDYAMEIIEDSNVDLADEKYDTLYEEISENLSAQINIHVEPTSDEKSSIAEVSKSIETTVSHYFEEYDIPMDSFQTSVISTCLAKEFYKEEYIDEEGSISVTVDDVLDFFGITKDDLNSGNIDIDLPDDVELPEGFDPSDLPEGFDPSDYLPESETNE